MRVGGDYTTAFMNIGGFVCLRSVLSFGVGALILIYIVDPAVSGITGKLSPRMRNPFRRFFSLF